MAHGVDALWESRPYTQLIKPPTPGPKPGGEANSSHSASSSQQPAPRKSASRSHEQLSASSIQEAAPSKPASHLASLQAAIRPIKKKNMCVSDVNVCVRDGFNSRGILWDSWGNTEGILLFWGNTTKKALISFRFMGEYSASTILLYNIRKGNRRRTPILVHGAQFQDMGCRESQCSVLSRILTRRCLNM